MAHSKREQLIKQIIMAINNLGGRAISQAGELANGGLETHLTATFTDGEVIKIDINSMYVVRGGLMNPPA